MALNTESFVFYESTFKNYLRLKKLVSLEAADMFLEAVCNYGLYGIIPEEDDIVWAYGLEQTITSISSAKDRYVAARENGSKGGRPSTIDYNKADELRAQGYTYKDIAAQIGCSVSSLEKYFRKKKQEPVKKVEDITRNNRKNPNDNVTFSGFFTDVKNVGKGVFTADAAKTLPVAERDEFIF